jgi:hypothetical protein
MVGRSQLRRRRATEEEKKEDGSDDGDWEDDDFDCEGVVPTNEPAPLDDGVNDLSTTTTSTNSNNNNKNNNDTDDTEWFANVVTKTTPAEPTNMATTKTKTTAAEDDRPPLLLIDLTVLSKGRLHNKHDPSSCNDSDEKRKWTKLCTKHFQKYRDDITLIQAGTVRSCGQTVWRDALAQLRAEYPGHFWAPIFPPK